MNCWTVAPFPAASALLVCQSSLLAGIAFSPSSCGVWFQVRVRDAPPRAIRIEGRHAGRDGGRARSEILLVDHALVIDDEGHHAGIAVLCRIGDERETADHL